MLYDPKWEKTETRADPLQLTSLIAWLEQQVPAASYAYDCNGGCLLALYFRAHGYPETNMGCFRFWWVDHGNIIWETIPKHFDQIARTRPHTFGAALDRARKIANA